MRKLIGLMATVFALSFVSVTHAGLILQDDENNTLQVNAFEPIGQSFVSEDATISFGFYFDCLNCGFTNSDSLRLNLLDGDGLGGSVLSSVDFFLADGFSGFYDVDLSGTILNVGSSYTATLEVLGDSPYWGIQANTNGGDAYTNGQMYESYDFISYTNADARFRVIPVDSASVPEPGSIILLGLGLAGLGFTRKKKESV